MYACAPCVCSAYGNLKRMLDPLELELQAVVSYPLGSWESNPGPLELKPVLLTIKPSLQLYLFILSQGLFV